MAETQQNPRQVTSPSVRPALLSLDEVLARMRGPRPGGLHEVKAG